MKFETIVQSAVIGATPDKVYEAYTSPERHSEFTGSRATGSPRVGGRFTAWDGYISGRFLELVKGKKIVQEWKTTEWPKGYPPSVVELRLEPKGRGTKLTMVHMKVPAEQAEKYAEGWADFYWKPLKRYLGAKDD